MQLDKLLFPEVVSHVRYQPRSGRTLQHLAMHCNELENEMGCRKSYLLAGGKGKGLNVSATSSHHRQKDSGDQRWNESALHDADWVSASFARADTYGLKANTCWHCFGSHSVSENDECHQRPCLFCRKTGHKSFYCFSAPSTKEDFEAALKLDA